jgi:uncharacterized coiled-coil DUF342 family protein
MKTMTEEVTYIFQVKDNIRKRIKGYEDKITYFSEVIQGKDHHVILESCDEIKDYVNRVSELERVLEYDFRLINNE